MNDKTIDLLLTTLLASPDNWQVRTHVASLMVAANRPSDAERLIDDGGEFPNNEDDLLELGNVLTSFSPNRALDAYTGAIAINKACAAAYLGKATAFHAIGDVESARKNYSVATVIDESLEDPAFEAALNSTTGTPPIQPRKMIPNLNTISAHGGDDDLDMDDDDEITPDEFIETDRLLEEAGTANIIDFNDIGGMETLKERIRMSIIHPFKNAELFAKFKKRTGGGLLFYGPPGCGKTLISRATAGECGAHFINISIHDVLSKWIGESEQRMHQIFVEARRKAPTIIFIDEIDALGIKRSDAGHTASLVNTLLTEIDGAASNNENVLVIGATNTPWRIDSAFRRPGRFDHVLFVPPPDQEARESILEIILNDIPQEKLNIQQIAKAAEKFSGADLRAAVERASEAVLSRIMKSGKDAVLTQKDLLSAIKQTRPTTLEWIEQASNYASYANQSGLYDDLADYIRSS